MKLYKISQTVNCNYDTYDSAIVVAESKKEARLIHPNGSVNDKKDRTWSDWANAKNVKVKELGTPLKKYSKPQVIINSFNAG